MVQRQSVVQLGFAYQIGGGFCVSQGERSRMFGCRKLLHGGTTGERVAKEVRP
jgi:hypothetical protein